MKKFLHRTQHLHYLALVVSMFMGTNALAESHPPPFPIAKPEDVGMSPEKLEKINRYLQQQIAKGELVGAVTMVARHGKVVHIGTHGLADRENNVPMSADTIFRLASNSKLISAVGAMIAWEEGKFQLDDPVNRWIPVLSKENLKVMQVDPKNPQQFSVVPAKRDITILDSLTMQSGLPYIGFARNFPPDSPAWKPWQDNEYLLSYYRRNDMTLAKYMDGVAKLPLLNQPGEQFNYGSDLHLVARVCEIAYKQSFNDFLQQRVLGPLRMNDTGFYFPASAAPRFSAFYEQTDKGFVRMKEGVVNKTFGIQPEWPYAYGPTTYYAPGEALNSTAIDYMRLLLMLRNGGELDGVRILKKETIAAMRRDRLGDKCCPQKVFHEGMGWGLGVAVVTDKTQFRPLSPGSYYWGGWFGLTWWIDPVKDIAGLFMTQKLPQVDTSADGFTELTYQAIVD